MTLLRALAACLLSMLLCAPSFAQERGTKDEAKAMVNAALAHIKKVGNEQASKDFSNDKANWTKKDLYVWTADFKGVVLAHGANEKLIEKSLLEMKDQNGKAFIKECVEVASSKGEGWVDYDWSHPITKKTEGKSGYVKRIPGFDGLIVVGAYR